MSWLVSAWYGFLLRCFFVPIVFIFNCKFSFVKKFNCTIVYSEIPRFRDSFSYGDGSAGKQRGLIDWFLFGAPYSIEGFLKNLSESLIIYMSRFVIAPIHYSSFTYLPTTWAKVFLFHPLLLSGISSIIIFEIRSRLVLLKNKSLNLSDQVLVVNLMCIILMGLNCLQDYKLC